MSNIIKNSLLLYVFIGFPIINHHGLFLNQDTKKLDFGIYNLKKVSNGTKSTQLFELIDHSVSNLRDDFVSESVLGENPKVSKSIPFIFDSDQNNKARGYKSIEKGWKLF